nr:class I SAM-dependent methyltransferase [Burkholderia cenocepacia]
MANWAIRTSRDRVLEPSAGDAAFLVAAVDRLRTLAPVGNSRPAVDGVEIHAHSARVADKRVRDAGGKARILHSDFFAVEPNPTYHAVIGNPPLHTLSRLFGRGPRPVPGSCAEGRCIANRPRLQLGCIHRPFGNVSPARWKTRSCTTR